MRSPHLFLLSSLLLLIIVLSTGMGYLEISPSEVIKIILARIIGDHELLKGLNHVFPGRLKSLTEKVRAFCIRLANSA